MAMSMSTMFSTGSDRLHEFSLRVLTVIVATAMVCSALLLLYRWLAPHERKVGTPFSMTIPAPVAPAAVAPAASVAPPEHVLMSPEHVFRCDSHGRISFSDHACESGAEKLMPLKSSKAPATTP
jgi:hypothetical protein